MVKLGIRLGTVANMVGKSESVADIGSDHALLPIWLLQEGKIQRAIAGELGDGPFERARQAVEASGWKSQLQVRQGDGLSVLRPGEVETVVIAGMGGDLMVEILKNHVPQTQSFSRYILQPMKHEAVLRAWLSKQGWPILHEQLIQENQKYYVALEMKPQAQAVRPLQPLEILLGPHLLRSKAPEVILWLKHMQKKYEKISNQVDSSRSALDEERTIWQERVSALKNILDQKIPYDNETFILGEENEVRK